MNVNFPWVMLLAYLFGSLPVGVWVAQAQGVDLRKIGSGNTGANNVLRSTGWGPAVGVALADILKGGMGVLIAQALGMPGWEVAMVGVAGVIGHNYSLFLALEGGRWRGFSGGKGVATTFGIILLNDPGLGIALLPIFIGVVYFTRYVSAGSILASMCSVVLSVAMQRPWWFTMMCLGLFALIVWAHRVNVENLRNGTERRFGEKAKSIAAQADAMASVPDAGEDFMDGPRPN